MLDGAEARIWPGKSKKQSSQHTIPGKEAHRAATKGCLHAKGLSVRAYMHHAGGTAPIPSQSGGSSNRLKASRM